MTESVVVCPFCNCRIDRVADRAKPECPRCEAPLPATMIAELPSAETATALPAPPASPGKRQTVVGVLGIMALMASLATGFALWTKEFRRQNDFKKGFVAADPTSRTPIESATLGYLPARCNVIGGLSVADLRANPAAKAAFLDRPPESIAWLAERLKSVGLTLDDVDDVAVGVEIADKPPNIYVIVRTRAPYDARAVVNSFAPLKATTLRDRPMVRFPLPYVGEGAAWCMTDRLLAFLFRAQPGPADDLLAIPTQPRIKLDGSSAEVKYLVEQRIDKQSLAWLAADMTPAAGLADFLSLVGAKIEPYRPLLEAKAIAVSIKTDADVVVLAQILAGSDKGLAALERSLRETDWRGEKSKKVETPPPDAQTDPWATLQLRYDPPAIRDLLGKGPAPRVGR